MFALQKSSELATTEMAAGADRYDDGHEPHNTPTPASSIDATSESRVAITIEAAGYSKEAITISKGATVTWTNTDSTPHNVMSAHSGDDYTHGAPAASDVVANVLAGPLLARGERYSFTFVKTGTFDYHCAPHPEMTGVVIVVE